MHKCHQIFRWLLLLSVMMIGDNYSKAVGCLEAEKIGLLNLKDFLNRHNRIVPSTWGGGEQDCCRWEGVTCDDDVFSKRIVNLSVTLVFTFQKSESHHEWFLDASLFQPFEELQNLTVHRLNWNSSLPAAGIKGRLKLTKLQVLDFSDNGFQILPSIWALASLKTLRLSENWINGTLPERFCTLTNLEELDLSDNLFEGVIPTCLRKLTSLQFLDLSGNQFSGIIPSNLFFGLKSLRYVSLSHNYFDGLFSFSSLENNSKIEVFKLENDSPMLKVETENVKWKPKLQILALSNCIVNEPNGRIIPSFLLTQYDLRFVDLSNNGINGELPSWLLANNSRLEYLVLRNNSFFGPLMLQLGSYNAYMGWLDVSNNQVTGEIPSFIGSVLPKLIYLDMSMNAIEGGIPSSIKNMTELIQLDLSNNHIYGEIPVDLFYGCEKLGLLKLSNNILTTFLPLKNSPRLPLITSLFVLDISYNLFTGPFPDLITKLSNLKILVLSKNHFDEKLPAAFCNLKHLEILDLSWNNFIDTLPPCIQLPYLSRLHLQGNKFHGPLPNFLPTSSSLVLLDVSNNKFSGLIPAWIGSFQDLSYLLLSRNIFHGSIPSQLCHMKNLNIIDLAANSFTGSIPSCLFHIPIGKSKAFDTRLVRITVYFYRLTISTSYPNMKSILSSWDLDFDITEQVQFITKSISRSYGFKSNTDIWYFISGIDLSLNKLSGPIPVDVDNWENVHSLNLSNNYLNGSIPWTLSRIQILESLDLSHNMLSGKIPSEMSKLTSLEVFSLAYNNLSGPTPIRSNQFGTFDSGSYEGNPLLCGPPLVKSCGVGPTEMPRAKPSAEPEEDDSSFKIEFLWSFIGSFGVSCIGAFVYLYFGSNVPQIVLQWIGVEEKTPCRRTVELPWKLINR